MHYFVFNDQDAIRQGAFLKLNPPIRAETERLEMWRSLADGEIDLVSTDHVAWPVSRKSDPDMAKNGSGIPGLETLLPAFYTGAVRDHRIPRRSLRNWPQKIRQSILDCILVRAVSRSVRTQTSRCFAPGGRV